MLYKLLEADLNRLRHFQELAPIKMGVFKFLTSCLNARFLPNVLCRLAYYFYTKNWRMLAKIFSSINFFLFGIEIAMKCEIGSGLVFPHTIGTVIGAEKIGSNALIYHGVTIGAKEMDMSYTSAKRPMIGDNVTIGAGAKILGGINIGNNVIVGANAVVTESIPDNVMVTGIPAKIKKEISLATQPTISK